MVSLFGYRLLKRQRLDPEFFDRFKSIGQFLPEKRPMIFDVGANIGQTVAAYKRQWPDSVIHSFEPQVDEFDELVKVSKQYSDVRCNNMALGANAGTLPLVRNVNYPAVSSFFKVNTSSRAISENIHPKARFEIMDNTQIKEANVGTLDDYVDANDIARIDLLKIVTAGFEVEVLKGGQKTLAAGKVGLVLSEIILDNVYERTSSFYEVESEIKDHGFRLYDIPHLYKDLKRGRTHWLHAVYVNTKRHSL